MQHVAVLHLVGLALDAELAGFAGARLALARDVVLIGDGLGADEALLEVGMDDRRRLGGGGTGLDRPGLLYDLTRSIATLNLNIGSAHISTFGEKVVDVFYVTDLTGQKIANIGRQEIIRERLEAAVEGQVELDPAAPVARKVRRQAS